MKKLKSKLFFIQAVLLHIILTVVVIIVSWQLIEPNAYNFMIKNFVATKNSSDDIAVVVIDDKSIAYHRWPWPREYYGKIINYLNEYAKPKLIGYDAVIASPDTTDPKSDEYFYNAVRNCDNLVVASLAVTQGYENESGKLYEKEFFNKFHQNIIADPSLYKYIGFMGLSLYPDKYFNAVKYAGFANVGQEPDKPLFDILQVLILNEKYYPSFGLRMYMKLHNANTIEVHEDWLSVKGTPLILYGNFNPFGFYSKLRYYKLRGHSGFCHKKYSAIDLINSYDALKQGRKPEIDPKEFAGKVVLVGANATSAALELEDALQSPLLPRHPGVDIQATNLDNLIHNDFLRATGFLQDFATIVGMVILTLLIIGKCPFVISIALLLILSGGYFGASIYAFSHGVAVTVITPILVQLLTTLFGYSYRFLQEGRNKEKIKQAMGKYLSQDIMKNVVQNIDDIKLGGEKKANVTVLFADIRGFTAMCDDMNPQDITKILNEYFTEVEPIITKHKGVINKFIGDAVMAIFGEPILDLNHPVNAVRCANEMLIKVEQLRKKWQEEEQDNKNVANKTIQEFDKEAIRKKRLAEFKSRFEIGIGINTGEAFVGNIGSEKRLEYTVIGDTVNLASRIESYNKVYKTNFLISSSTYSYVSSIVDVLKISEVQIRGKAKKMDIYEVLRLN